MLLEVPLSALKGQASAVFLFSLAIVSYSLIAATTNMMKNKTQVINFDG